MGGYLPYLTYEGTRPGGGLWGAGWALVCFGAAIYLICLVSFLLKGGTPAIFFTRSLRFLLGEEPQRLVSQGLYRVSRNPMYVGVIVATFGQAIVFASANTAVYAVGACCFFDCVVVFLEEPHLRKERGEAYVQYCRTVPRWIGLPRRPNA